jgi:putative membrane protein
MVNAPDSANDTVSAAVAEAESRSNGEIVTVLSDTSDAYHDVGLHWAVAALLAVLALAAAFPAWLTGLHGLVTGGGWDGPPSLAATLFLLMIVSIAVFTIVLLVLKHRPLRMALTPAATKQRRVRRRAIELFKVATERRTVGRTGVLLYLSMAEHRAEIVADEAIHSVTTPETWGDAMEALLIEVKAGRPVAGLVAAIHEIGVVLSEHSPRTVTDTNEIPDKLIQL